MDEYVRRFGLDALLSGDLVDALRPLGKEPGELFIRAGDPVKDVMFFVEGRAKAYGIMENGHAVLASFYEPFDVFGEAELFSSPSYALSVEALVPSLCLVLPATKLLNAASRNYRLFMYLCGRLGAKLTDRFAAEAINLRYPVESRLASYLLASADADGRLQGTDDLGELADFLGASYRQLARAVRRFRDEGILARTRGRIRVVARERLVPLAADVYIQTGRCVTPRAFTG